MASSAACLEAMPRAFQGRIGPPRRYQPGLVRQSLFRSHRDLCSAGHCASVVDMQLATKPRSGEHANVLWQLLEPVVGPALMTRPDLFRSCAGAAQARRRLDSFLGVELVSRRRRDGTLTCRASDAKVPAPADGPGCLGPYRIPSPRPAMTQWSLAAGEIRGDAVSG